MGINVVNPGSSECWFKGTSASSYSTQLSNLASTLYDNNQVSIGTTGLSGEVEFKSISGWAMPECESHLYTNFNRYFAYRVKFKDGNIREKNEDDEEEEGEPCVCPGDGEGEESGKTNSGRLDYKDYVLRLSDCLTPMGEGYLYNTDCDHFCLFNTGKFCYSNSAKYGCYNATGSSTGCQEAEDARQAAYDDIDNNKCDCCDEELESCGGGVVPMEQEPLFETDAEEGTEEFEDAEQECEKLEACEAPTIKIKFKNLSPLSITGCDIKSSLCSAGDLYSVLHNKAMSGVGSNAEFLCADFVVPPGFSSGNNNDNNDE